MTKKENVTQQIKENKDIISFLESIEINEAKILIGKFEILFETSFNINSQRLANNEKVVTDPVFYCFNNALGELAELI